MSNLPNISEAKFSNKRVTNLTPPNFQSKLLELNLYRNRFDLRMNLIPTYLNRLNDHICAASLTSLLLGLFFNL